MIFVSILLNLFILCILGSKIAVLCLGVVAETHNSKIQPLFYKSKSDNFLKSVVPETFSTDHVNLLPYHHKPNTVNEQAPIYQFEAFNSDVLPGTHGAEVEELHPEAISKIKSHQGKNEIVKLPVDDRNPFHSSKLEDKLLDYLPKLTKLYNSLKSNTFGMNKPSVTSNAENNLEARRYRGNHLLINQHSFRRSLLKEDSNKVPEPLLVYEKNISSDHSEREGFPSEKPSGDTSGYVDDLPEAFEESPNELVKFRASEPNYVNKHHLHNRIHHYHKIFSKPNYHLSRRPLKNLHPYFHYEPTKELHHEEPEYVTFPPKYKFDVTDLLSEKIPEKGLHSEDFGVIIPKHVAVLDSDYLKPVYYNPENKQFTVLNKERPVNNEDLCREPPLYKLHSSDIHDPNILYKFSELPDHQITHGNQLFSHHDKHPYWRGVVPRLSSQSYVDSALLHFKKYNNKPPLIINERIKFYPAFLRSGSDYHETSYRYPSISLSSLINQLEEKEYPINKERTIPDGFVGNLNNEHSVESAIMYQDHASNTGDGNVHDILGHSIFKPDDEEFMGKLINFGGGQIPLKEIYDFERYLQPSSLNYHSSRFHPALRRDYNADNVHEGYQYSDM